MEGVDQERVDQIKSSIDLIDDNSIARLPFNLFERKGNRTTKLIITSGESTPIDGKKRWFDFTFREITLVSTLTVELNGYSDFSEFDVRWVDEKGKEHQMSAYPADNTLTVRVNDLCRSISFRPPTMIFFSTYVNSVIIEGIERGNINKALTTLSDIQSYTDDVIDIVDKAVARADSRIAEGVRLAAERAQIQREITQSKANLARVKKGIDDASLTRSELIAQNSAVENTISQLNSKIRDLTSQNSSLENQRNILRNEAKEAEKKLKELTENINIFPSEIVGFANQARRTGWQYFALAAVPIAVIVFMFGMLVNGAANLTTIITDNPEVDIQTAMISRIPYVTIAVTIITACYKLARAFFMELIKINTQRLNLTKISIIARDISYSSEQSLDLTSEETYKLRTELKMDMLRDHMKEYISKDYKPLLPSRVIGLIDLGKKDDGPEKGRDSANDSKE